VIAVDMAILTHSKSFRKSGRVATPKAFHCSNFTTRSLSMSFRSRQGNSPCASFINVQAQFSGLEDGRKLPGKGM
jgi:hypothetical protein